MRIEHSKFHGSALFQVVDPCISVREKHHSEQVSHYRTHENALNFNGIQFPIKPVDIARFERQNVDISVNVLSCDRENKGFFCCLFESRGR